MNAGEHRSGQGSGLEDAEGSDLAAVSSTTPELPPIAADTEGRALAELKPLAVGHRSFSAARWALLRQLARQGFGSWTARLALLLPLPLGVFAALSRWLHRLLGEFFQATQATLDTQAGDQGGAGMPAFAELPELPPLGDVTLELTATLIKWVLPVLLTLLLLRVAAAGSLTQSLWLKGPFIQKRYWLGLLPWLLAASAAWLACLAGLAVFLGLAQALEPVGDGAALVASGLRAAGVLALACMSCAAVVLAALLLGRRTVEGLGFALVALWGPGLLGAQSGLWLLSPALSLSEGSSVGELRWSRLFAVLLVTLVAGALVHFALLGDEGRAPLRRKVDNHLRRPPRASATAAVDEPTLGEENGR